MSKQTQKKYGIKHGKNIDVFPSFIFVYLSFSKQSLLYFGCCGAKKVIFDTELSSSNKFCLLIIDDLIRQFSFRIYIARTMNRLDVVCYRDEKTMGTTEYAKCVEII